MSSLLELYRALGVPKSTINSLLGTKKTNLPKLSTFLHSYIHICEGFKITLKEFYDDKLFDDVMSE